MRIIEVVEYQSSWIAAFESERAVLQNALGENAIAIHHIGSTSVPGLAAKPVIDILVEVSDLGLIDDRVQHMIRLGYVPRGELGIPGRRYFSKGGEQRTHHVHAFVAGSSQILRHLAFRDYLRQRPDEASAYARLKIKIARECGNDPSRYFDGKDVFVKALEARALNANLPNHARAKC